MVDLLEEQECSTIEAAESAGISMRQIHHWVACEYLNPTRANKGSGYSMTWSKEEVEKATLLKKLIDLGLTVRMAAYLCQSKNSRRKLITDLIELDGGQWVLLND